MKITKRQLRRIIKEERARLIKERIVEHPLGPTSANVGSIKRGLEKGTMPVADVIERLAAVEKALYDFIRQERELGGL